MADRTLESALHPDCYLAVPSAELPSLPVRVLVTILKDDEHSEHKVVHLRSPRLVHPEQAVEVIEVTDMNTAMD